MAFLEPRYRTSSSPHEGLNSKWLYLWPCLYTFKLNKKRQCLDELSTKKVRWLTLYNFKISLPFSSWLVYILRHLFQKQTRLHTLKLRLGNSLLDNLFKCCKNPLATSCLIIHRCYKYLVGAVDPWNHTLSETHILPS